MYLKIQFKQIHLVLLYVILLNNIFASVCGHTLQHLFTLIDKVSYTNYVKKIIVNKTYTIFNNVLLHFCLNNYYKMI